MLSSALAPSAQGCTLGDCAGPTVEDEVQSRVWRVDRILVERGEYTEFWRKNATVACSRNQTCLRQLVEYTREGGSWGSYLSDFCALEKDRRMEFNAVYFIYINIILNEFLVFFSCDFFCLFFLMLKCFLGDLA